MQNIESCNIVVLHLPGPRHRFVHLKIPSDVNGSIRSERNGNEHNYPPAERPPRRRFGGHYFVHRPLQSVQLPPGLSPPSLGFDRATNVSLVAKISYSTLQNSSGPAMHNILDVDAHIQRQREAPRRLTVWSGVEGRGT